MGLSEPSSGQIFIWLFLDKTVIPQENFHFKKNNFHWKIILMEKGLAMATKDKTTDLSQGEVNAKASGLGLPQSSCRIMGTTPPFAGMFVLLLHRPSALPAPPSGQELSLIVCHEQPTATRVFDDF